MFYASDSPDPPSISLQMSSSEWLHVALQPQRSPYAQVTIVRTDGRPLQMQPSRADIVKPFGGHFHLTVSGRRHHWHCGSTAAQVSVSRDGSTALLRAWQLTHDWRPYRLRYGVTFKRVSTLHQARRD